MLVLFFPTNTVPLAWVVTRASNRMSPSISRTSVMSMVVYTTTVVSRLTVTVSCGHVLIWGGLMLMQGLRLLMVAGWVKILGSRRSMIMWQACGVASVSTMTRV